MTTLPLKLIEIKLMKSIIIIHDWNNNFLSIIIKSLKKVLDEDFIEMLLTEIS